MRVERKKEMVEAGKINKELGFHYEVNGEEFVEFHVDDHVEFQEECSILPYGGYLSVRKDPNQKPLMILGQDECIFKQFISRETEGGVTNPL